MLNHQIQNYKFISLLGEGGMATVYLAQDNKFDTNVAVKLLNKEFVNNENIRKRFLAEARSMFKMSHPNIIKVTDLIEDGDTVAFVMEYVEGETLKEYIERKGKLNDSEIKTIFSQMLDAVGYVHEQNLVHRDIKPSNFMLDKNGKIKLMDFGIAKTTDSNSAEYTQTGTGMQMGTPMYMSPEQIRSSKEVNHLTDIYSLGVVLWQMVVGQKPYDTRTLSNFDLQSKIVNEPLPKSNTVWDRIIEKATQKEVDKRFLNCINFKYEVIGGRNFASNKNEENTVDHTIIENSLNPKEKIISDKTEEVNESLSIEEKPTKKHSWLLPAIVLMVVAIVLFFYFRNDTVKDIDGNTYNVVKIGNQYWMKENLNVSKFRNGDLIPEVKSFEDWKKAGENNQPAWCYLQSKESNGKKHGKLYNWYAVNDPRGLAPDGWHVPSKKEWNQLIKTVGGEKIACKKLKSKQGWIKDGNGTDEFGFTGLPGGFTDNYANSYIGYFGLWWSTTEYGKDIALYIPMIYAEDYVHIEADGNKALGLSVRCLRD